MSKTPMVMKKVRDAKTGLISFVPVTNDKGGKIRKETERRTFHQKVEDAALEFLGYIDLLTAENAQFLGTVEPVTDSDGNQVVNSNGIPQEEFFPDSLVEYTRENISSLLNLISNSGVPTSFGRTHKGSTTDPESQNLPNGTKVKLCAEICAIFADKKFGTTEYLSGETFTVLGAMQKGKSVAYAIADSQGMMLPLPVVAKKFSATFEPESEDNV